MADTAENILIAALGLFARDGYEAVSVSQIAGALGMAKSALYKHYKNKRDIFDSIVERMRCADAAHAKAYDVPVDALTEADSAYQALPLDSIRAFAEAQFRYWTEDAFAARFRKMLTLEQYRSPEMARLFRQHLSAGPLQYTEDLFFGLLHDRAEARRLAVRFYAPMFLMYSVYDGADDKRAATKMLTEHFDRFMEEQWI